MKILSVLFLLLCITVMMTALLVASTNPVLAQQEQQPHREEDSQDNNNDQTAYSKALATPRSIPSQELMSLPVSRLRRFIGDRGADCDGCLEKNDLVQRAVEVMTWPTREDALAAELSLEQDLMGPLVNDLSIPVGDDRSPFFDQYNDEKLEESPSARSSVKPLSDEDVVTLLELHRMRTLIAEGIARCGPRHLNGTQFCQPTAALITRETE